MKTFEEWYVKYHDPKLTPPPEVEARRIQSKKAAVEHARKLERRYTVHSIVAATGETPWEQIR